MMTNLIKHNDQLAFPGTKYQGLKCRHESEKILKKHLFEQIQIGYKITKTQSVENLKGVINSTVEVLYPEIIEHYGQLTIDEIRQAIRMGCYGHFGQFYGLTPESIVGFLRSYMNSDARKIKIKSVKTSDPEPKPRKPMTKEEAEKYWQEMKSDYLKSGRLIGGVNLFRIGVKLGHIDITDEWFTNEVKEETAQWFQAELERVKMLGGIVERDRVNELKRVIGATMEQRSEIELWQAQCKRQAVRKVFESNN